MERTSSYTINSAEVKYLTSARNELMSYNNMRRRKRMKGDTWDFKNVCGEIFRLIHIQYPTLSSRLCNSLVHYCTNPPLDTLCVSAGQLIYNSLTYYYYNYTGCLTSLIRFFMTWFLWPSFIKNIYNWYMTWFFMTCTLRVKKSYPQHKSTKYLQCLQCGSEVLILTSARNKMVSYNNNMRFYIP